MTKEELVERLENNSWLNKSPRGKLIIKLVKGTEETDPDFKKALEDDMCEAIIDLDMDCYDDTDFLKWLANHDFDLFVDYRFAETMTREEMIEEYSEDEDEWDWLIHNDDCSIYVKRW